MKKGLIVFLVFALALVLILGFSGVFKKNGIPQTILTVTATNTEYVVKDDSGNIVPNKSEITIGHSYTITLYENEEYELKTFKINGTSLLTQLENNQYTFLCNGATNVTIISALIVPGGDVISNYTINYISLNHPSGSSMLGWAQQPDIDLLVYDAYENLIAQLDEGESFTPNQNQAYVIDAVFTNCTSTKAITYRFAHGGIWYPFPCHIENVSHNYDLHITYNFLGISFNSNMQADLINITDVGGSEVFDLTVGETYTINDITPEGYKVVLSQNGQNLALPHTFVYTEDLRFDIEIMEEEVEYTTITYQFSNIESITLSKRDGTGEEFHLDVSTGTASVQLELGTDYNYEIVATAEYVITSTIYNGSDFLRNPTPAISGHLTIVENGVYQINTQQSNAGIYLNLALPNNSNGYISYTIGIFDPELGSQVDTRSVVVTSQSAPTSVYVDLNAYAGYGLTFEAGWIANGTSNSEPLLIAFADNPDFVNTLYGNNIAANSFPVYNIIFDENSAAGAA